MCNCNKIYKIEELRKCAGRGKDSEYYIPELDEWMNFRKVEEIMSSLGLVNWVHYFNRYMFGVDDPEYIPTCANPGCNNKVSGFSRIRGHNKFCSLKCRSEASWKDSDIRNRMMSNNIVFSYPKGLIGYIMSNPELYENWRSKTPSCQPGGLHKYLIDHNCENYINFIKNGGVFGFLYRSGVNVSSFPENSSYQYVQGDYESPKCSNIIHYRSSYELRYLRILDADTNVISFEYESLYLPYEYEGKSHVYIVDFIINYSDNTSKLKEVKPYHKLTEDLVVLKAEVGRKYAETLGIEYEFVTEKDIKILEKKFGLTSD